MPHTPLGSLRQAPQQHRARQRVEAILDAAAEVFDEFGYDASTTTQIVERAAVSPGTLYRWFPDKPALADALAERYLNALVVFYEPLLTNDPDEPVPAMIRRVLRELTAFVSSQRALAALLASAVLSPSPSTAGQRLEANLGEQISGLIDVRVPGIDRSDRDRVAGVILRVLLTMLTTVPTLDEVDRAAGTEEYCDLLVAYVDAKFPGADDPVWNREEPTVRPLLAAPQIAES